MHTIKKHTTLATITRPTRLDTRMKHISYFIYIDTSPGPPPDKFVMSSRPTTSPPQPAFVTKASQGVVSNFRLQAPVMENVSATARSASQQAMRVQSPVA